MRAPLIVASTLVAFLTLFRGTEVLAAVVESDPPKVEIQVLPDAEGMEAGQSLPLVVLVTNRSPVHVKDLKIEVGDKEIAVELPGFPASLPPFGGAWRSGRFRPRSSASFGSHHVLFVLRYGWDNGAFRGHTLQSATVVVKVRRPFAEEVEGLPVGTGALFSLLFPVIPAFLAFQIVDRLRKKEALRLPTFGNEYIVPAFFVAIGVNSLTLFTGMPPMSGLDDVYNRLLLGVLAGALWPAVHWAWDAWQWHRWGFRDSDSKTSYLRKALLSPWVPRQHIWVTGVVGEQTWSGLLLRQPDGQLALGSTLLIVHPTSSGPKELETAEDLVTKANEGNSQSRRDLLARIQSGTLQAEASEFPLWRRPGDDSEPARVNRLVVTEEEVEGFVRKFGERKDLLAYSV